MGDARQGSVVAVGAPDAVGVDVVVDVVAVDGKRENGTISYVSDFC